MHSYFFLISAGCVLLWAIPVSCFSSSHKPPPRRKHSYHQSSGISSPTEKTTVILYHKPANIISSHISNDDRKTVYEDIESMNGFIRSHSDGRISKPTPILSLEDATGIRSKLHAIGRLDADTTGLLLLTNDGGLVHHVTNRKASTHVGVVDSTAVHSLSASTAGKGVITKTYEALIMGHHTDESLHPLWEGVDIGSKYGGWTRPVDDLQILEHPNHKSTLVSITISEGKNRQVRRMFHALGSGVIKLKRIKIGEYLSLEGIEEGSWRLLTDTEVQECLGWRIRQNIHVSSDGNRVRDDTKKGARRSRRRRKNTSR